VISYWNWRNGSGSYYSLTVKMTGHWKSLVIIGFQVGGGRRLVVGASVTRT
jgi:hypothetical protein